VLARGGVGANRARGLAFEEHVAGTRGEVLNRGAGRMSVMNSEGTWIPDFASVAEAKAVHGALSMTRQLRVAAQYARETGRQVTLYVLPDTTFSGRLEIAIAGGLFRVVRVVGFE